MIKLLPLLVVLLCGCTSTCPRWRQDVLTNGTVRSEWSMRRTSLLQKMEIGTVTISTNGTVSLRGYKNDGGSESLKQIALQLEALAEILKRLKVP